MFNIEKDDFQLHRKSMTSLSVILDAHHIGVCGGVEHFCIWLANELSRHGHSVHLFTCAPEGTPPAFPLESTVRIVTYRYAGLRSDLPEFRHQIQSCAPDVCLCPASSRHHLIWSAALMGTAIPLVYSEHGDAAVIERTGWNRWERLAAMSGADAIHLLRESATPLPKCLAERVTIIGNPVLVSGIRAYPETSQTLLSLGRLSSDKDNALLVEAFSLLAKEFSQWKLEIWGDGEERQHLQRIIDRLSLRRQVLLAGATTHPASCYERSAVYCFPSRHEGMPNSVLEAMSAGLPVVAFADCAGATALVHHEKNGLLASERTAVAFANCLRYLMQDAQKRKRLSITARTDMEAYRPDIIYTQWERLLRTVVLLPSHRLLLDSMRDAEEAVLFHNLQDLTSREHLFIPSTERLRLFIHRHPLLHHIQYNIRKKLRLIL